MILSDRPLPDSDPLSWCGRVLGPACIRDGHHLLCPECQTILKQDGNCIRCDAVAGAAERRQRVVDSPQRVAREQEAQAERERQREVRRQEAEAEQRRRREATARKIDQDKKREAAEKKAKKRKIGAKEKIVKKKARPSGVVKQRAGSSVQGTRRSLRLAILRKDGKCIY